MIAHGFKRVGSFEVKDLPRQITQLEENVTRSFQATASTAAARGTVASIKIAAYTAVVDEIVPVDTTNGDVTITIPVATPQNAGRRVAIVKLVAAGTVTVQTASGLVQGAPSDAFSTQGLYEYVSLGTEWWGPP